MTGRFDPIVLDTNVLISALLFPGSLPALCLSVALRTGTVVASSQTLHELASVLLRPKFDKHIKLETRVRTLVDFRSCIHITQVTEKVRVCRDPDDDAILELAFSAQANSIITGDRDLLVLHPWRGIQILSPSDYLARSG